MGDGHGRFIIVRDVTPSLVQLDYVALVCLPRILYVLKDGLPNMGFEVLDDLGGSRKPMHDSLDHG